MMNFTNKIIFCYEYLFYKQYTCFGCGVDFQMKQMKEDEDFDFSPACSYSCLMAVLPNKEKQLEIDNFKNKYGKEWKIKYAKYIKIFHHMENNEKMRMIRNGEIDEFGNDLKFKYIQ